MERLKPYLPGVVGSALFLLGAVAWNHAYIQPREAFLDEVMECMAERAEATPFERELTPEADYRACVEQVTAKYHPEVSEVVP